MKISRSKLNKNYIVFIILLVACLLCILLNFSTMFFKNIPQSYQPQEIGTNKTTIAVSETSKSNAVAPKIYYLVTEVIDGDTIKVKINEEIFKVRLIGIDTPENTTSIDCYGAEASQKLKDLILNKNIELTPDITQTDKDRYNRLLRYVYLENGDLINLQLVKSGYAKEYTYDKVYKYQSILKEAEQKAKNDALGLWGNSCRCEKDSIVSKSCSGCNKSRTIFNNWDCSTYEKISNDATCSLTCPVVVAPVQPTYTQPSSPSFECDCSKVCGAMISCQEANYQLNICGCSQRDANNDGVPCNSMCG